MQNVKPSGSPRAEATPEDVTRIVGDIDAETLLAIMALHPSVSDLEEVALRVAGNGEAMGGKQATGIVAEILDLLDTDEEEPALVRGSGPI
jgi:hypothetical protein